MNKFDKFRPDFVSVSTFPMNFPLCFYFSLLVSSSSRHTPFKIRNLATNLSWFIFSGFRNESELDRRSPLTVALLSSQLDVSLPCLSLLCFFCFKLATVCMSRDRLALLWDLCHVNIYKGWKSEFEGGLHGVEDNFLSVWINLCSLESLFNLRLELTASHADRRAVHFKKEGAKRYRAVPKLPTSKTHSFSLNTLVSWLWRYFTSAERITQWNDEAF
jgi:hypothetical protein